MKSIIIIEDDPAISRGLNDLFVAENYNVTVEHNGESGLKKTLNNNYDLLILDLTLPGMSGMDICKNLRSSGSAIPILMLTSRKEEIDKVLGLELGADDYVTKPFSTAELTARVKALLRRNDYIRTGIGEFGFADVKVNFKSFEVFKGVKQVLLSSTELKMLKFFISHAGEVITREKLLDEIWGYNSFPTTRTVDNFILSLRKKLETNPSQPEHFLTVPKAGYKFIT